jgi:Dna[CI] antecedent, DciA
MSMGDRKHQTMSLRDAVQACDVLSRLSQRMALSQRYWAAIIPALPPMLAAHIQAGPIDEASWCLLCRNAAVAAKLRHLAPGLQQHMVAAHLPVLAVRIKTLGS